MDKFFIRLVSIFTSCIFNTKNVIECEGIMVPYRGHPIENVRQMSLQNSPQLSARTTAIRLNLPLQLNSWQLMNTMRLDAAKQQQLGNIPQGLVLEGHDGIKSILTARSSKHLCTNHGHQVGIDDRLPPNPNAKPRKYPRIQTKTTDPANELFFVDVLQKIMKDPESTVFEDVKIRGVNGHGYFTTTNYGPDNSRYKGFFIGIHKEGPEAGRLLKAQPVGALQLQKLLEFNKID